MSDALDRLANGDLTHRIHEPFEESDGLRQNYNAAADTLHATMTEVMTCAQDIFDSSTEIGSSTADLAKRTAAQAATLEETTAGLEEITSATGTTATAASETNAITKSVHDSAGNSANVVRDAHAAIELLSQSSRKISVSVGVIDDIAFQTNLLALNAGVEAARAGEAGKGFAVVAAEVQQLALYSTNAAKDVKDQIKLSEEQVRTCVAMVQNTGDAIHNIQTQIKQITDQMAQLDTASGNQASAMAEINTGMAEMDRVTQQNAAMVEASSQDGQRLLSVAKRLNTLMQGFTADHGETAMETHARAA